MSIAEKLKTISDNVDRVYSSGGYVGSQQGMKFQESEDSKKIHQELQRQEQTYNTKSYENKDFDTNMKNLVYNVDNIALAQNNSGYHQGTIQQSYSDYLKTNEVIEWQIDAYGDEGLQAPKETFEENIEVIKDNTNALFTRGLENGEEMGKEVGKEQAWNNFWEVFQKGGEPMSYLHAFSNGKFTDANYNPKYPIDCTYTVASVAQYAFYGSPITDTKVEIIVGANRVLSSTFENCRELVTIRKLTLKGNNGFTSTFENCTSLENIEINGTIEKVINFQYSPLSKASIENVVNALSDTTSGLTVTFNEAAVNNAFSPEDWEALADTKKNWTITLA